MIVVIQCAASKNPEAGYLRRRDDRKILFVANPENAPADTPFAYARPDDCADTGRSWREELLLYNEAPDNNPLGLLPAWQLYKNETYARLAERYGTDRLYVLSAGWGLIAADFLTPKYDITFSPHADDLKKRQPCTLDAETVTFSPHADGFKQRPNKPQYDDLRMLSDDTEECVVFFVSKNYVPLACKLTNGLKSPRYLFYNSSTAPYAPGCILKKYDTRTRTNWQYECARAFMDGRIACRSE